MIENHDKKILGILGGMGPLASAEFLKTIYEYNIRGEHEQEFPKVVLHSDPSFPDRTEVLLRGEYDSLLEKLIADMYRLCASDVSRIVICCITSHYLLSELPDELKKRVISLTDVILEKAVERKTRHLMLCSTGTWKLMIFQNHSLWPLSKDYIVFPDETDQNAVHDMIYQIKSGSRLNKCMDFLYSLLSKYETDFFIAGCTEIHLLNKKLISLRSNPGNEICIDPLIIIAKYLENIYNTGKYRQKGSDIFCHQSPLRIQK